MDALHLVNKEIIKLSLWDNGIKWKYGHWYIFNSVAAEKDEILENFKIISKNPYLLTNLT